MLSKYLAKRLLRLPLQRVREDCKACDIASVVPGSVGLEARLLQTSQGLAPQLRWLILGCAWQGNSSSDTVQIILQLQQLWTIEELANMRRPVVLLNLLACLWLQWKQ